MQTAIGASARHRRELIRGGRRSENRNVKAEREPKIGKAGRVMCAPKCMARMRCWMRKKSRILMFLEPDFDRV